MKQFSASNHLIHQTYNLWQPRINGVLSAEDVRQIAENVTGLFGVLAEWSRAAKAISSETRLTSAAAPLSVEVRHDV